MLWNTLIIINRLETPWNACPQELIGKPVKPSKAALKSTATSWNTLKRLLIHPEVHLKPFEVLWSVLKRPETSLNPPYKPMHKGGVLWVQPLPLRMIQAPLRPFPKIEKKISIVAFSVYSPAPWDLYLNTLKRLKIASKAPETPLKLS